MSARSHLACSHSRNNSTPDRSSRSNSLSPRCAMTWRSFPGSSARRSRTILCTCPSYASHRTGTCSDHQEPRAVAKAEQRNREKESREGVSAGMHLLMCRYDQFVHGARSPSSAFLGRGKVMAPCACASHRKESTKPARSAAIVGLSRSGCRGHARAPPAGK